MTQLLCPLLHRLRLKKKPTFKCTVNEQYAFDVCFRPQILCMGHFISISITSLQR